MICCPAEGWHGSRCVLRREFNVLQPNFSLQLIWKKWTTCRLSLAARERPHAMYQSVFDCYKSDSSQTVHMTRKWKKMVNKLRRQRSPWHARSIFWPSQPIRRRGIGLKCAPQRGRVSTQCLAEMEGFPFQFSAVPFLDPPYKSWTCRSANLILDPVPCVHCRILVQVCAFT